MVTDAMKTGDFLSFLTFDPSFIEAAAECGLRSFIIMAGALDGKSVKPEFLSYEGTFGVGYAVAVFEAVGEDKNRHFDKIYIENEREKLFAVKNNEDDYVRLARLSLETYVKTGKKASLPGDLPAEMLNRRAGVLFRLKTWTTAWVHWHYRPITGCIAEEILRNAISAGTEDPRFFPVTEDELPSWCIVSMFWLSQRKLNQLLNWM